MHYHFTYDHSKHQIDGHYHEQAMQCNRMNFPYKSFYNPEDNVIYCFYRQGQAFTIDADDPANCRVERMTDKDLGQMYLFNNKALIARSSSTVLFFKIIADEDDPEEKSWQQYHMLNIRGFIYFIKGNKRIQITTDDNIYFYLIDLETFEPIEPGVPIDLAAPMMRSQLPEPNDFPSSSSNGWSLILSKLLNFS